MNQKRFELIRQEILDQLYANMGSSRAAEQIVKTARINGLVTDLTIFEVETQASALCSMRYVELQSFEFSQGVKRWTLTGDGIKYLEAKGLV